MKKLIFIIFIVIFNLGYAAKYSTTVNAPDEYGNTPLSTAIYNGNIEMIKLLLDNKMDPNTLVDDYYGTTLLMWALGNYELDLAKLIIKKGGDVNATNASGNSTLSYANSTEAIMFLLNNGLNSNATDSEGNTALMKGIVAEDYSLIQLALEKGANFDIENNYGMNALEIAVNKPNTEMVNLLVSNGLNPNISITSYDSYTRPLIIWAFEFNDYRLVQNLIEKGAQLEGTDYSAVDYALANNQIDLLKIMIEKGINLDLPRDSIEKDTILLWALKKNQIEVAKLLVEKGASIVKGNPTSRPLDYLLNNKIIDILKLAIEKGFDPNSFIDANNTDTLLSWAIINNQGEFIKFLIEKQIDVNKVYKNGWTALMMAAQRNDAQIVRLLLDNGANKSIKNNEGKVAAFYATSKDVKKLLAQNYNVYIYSGVGLLLTLLGFTFIKKQSSSRNKREKSNSNNSNIEKIMKSEKKLHKRDSLGQTPLFYILENDQKSFLKELLDKGIDINAVDNEGNTALLNALIKNKDIIALELINLGADIFTMNNKNEDAIYYSVMNNFKNISDLLISRGVDVTKNYNEQKTMLHIATNLDNLIGVKYLISKGINVNAEDIHGKTALSYSKSRDVEEIIKANGGTF